MVCGRRSRTASLNFGFAELGANYSSSKTVTLHNRSGTARTYAVTPANAAGSPATVGFSASSVTVPANGSTTVNVTLNVPAATAGNSAQFREVAGNVVFTLAGQPTLRVPYYFVPQGPVGRVCRL